MIPFVVGWGLLGLACVTIAVAIYFGCLHRKLTRKPSRGQDPDLLDTLLRDRATTMKMRWTVDAWRERMMFGYLFAVAGACLALFIKIKILFFVALMFLPFCLVTHIILSALAGMLSDPDDDGSNVELPRLFPHGRIRKR